MWRSTCSRMPVRDVAVVAFAQSPSFPDAVHNDVEVLTPVIAEAVKRSGIPRKEIGFICSGSCDYLDGRSRSRSSWRSTRSGRGHRCASRMSRWMARGRCTRRGCACRYGDVDSALVYGFGKSSLGDVRDVLGGAARPVLCHAALAGLGEPRGACRRGRFWSPTGTPNVNGARWWRETGQTPNEMPWHRSPACFDVEMLCRRRTRCRRCARTTARRSPTARRRLCSRRGTLREK